MIDVWFNFDGPSILAELAFIEQQNTPQYDIRNVPVSLASYEFRKDPDRIIAWPDQICDPSKDVMFLIGKLPVQVWYLNMDGILGDPRQLSYCPKYIITDGIKYCPLLRANEDKYMSFLGYGGLLYGPDDREIIHSIIRKFTNGI